MKLKNQTVNFTHSIVSHVVFFLFYFGHYAHGKKYLQRFTEMPLSTHFPQKFIPKLINSSGGCGGNAFNIIRNNVHMWGCYIDSYRRILFANSGKIGKASVPFKYWLKHGWIGTKSGKRFIRREGMCTVGCFGHSFITVNTSLRDVIRQLCVKSSSTSLSIFSAFHRLYMEFRCLESRTFGLYLFENIWRLVLILFNWKPFRNHHPKLNKDVFSGHNTTSPWWNPSVQILYTWYRYKSL